MIINFIETLFSLSLQLLTILPFFFPYNYYHIFPTFLCGDRILKSLSFCVLGLWVYNTISSDNSMIVQMQTFCIQTSVLHHLVFFFHVLILVLKLWIFLVYFMFVFFREFGVHRQLRKPCTTHLLLYSQELH